MTGTLNSKTATRNMIKRSLRAARSNLRKKHVQLITMRADRDEAVALLTEAVWLLHEHQRVHGHHLTHYPDAGDEWRLRRDIVLDRCADSLLPDRLKISLNGVKMEIPVDRLTP